MGDRRPWAGRNSILNHPEAVPLRMVFRLLALILAGLHTWVAISSQSMNPDGIAYLDIGDAYFRGDWANAINPVWPPLYSWILGLVNFIVKPSMLWEFPVVHITNLFIFGWTMLCFEYFWQKLDCINRRCTPAEQLSLPTWAWWAVGYSLFLWITLHLIQVWSVTPDMLMAGFVCLAAAQVAEIRTNPERIRPFVFLGIFLGLSYFSKTIMFSISVMLLGFFAVLVPRTWRSGVKVALAVGLFLLLALPFIMLISERKGKATFGEVGAVTYLRHVQGIPYPHWQGDSDGDVVLAHPSRQVYADPPIFEFDGPIGGTYPPSTEPSYWYDGVKVEINLKNQLSRILISGLYYLDVFANQLGILLGCTAAFYLIGLTQKTSPREIVRKWALTILGLYALVQYGLVLVLGRFLGVFVLLIWADFMTNVRVLKNVSNRLAVNGLSIVAVLGILLSLLGFNLAGLNRMDLISQPDVDSTITASAAKPLAVAQELQRLQIGPGSKAGVIGYGFDSYWARLARVQIVAEMLDRHAGRFWEGDAAQRQAAMQAFKGTGIDVVVAEHVPPYVRMDGWHRVGESNYYIYTFGAE